MKTPFDAAAWMRARRAKIDEEDQGLSWAEKHEKTRRLLETDPLWLRLRKRAVEPSSAPRMVVREPGADHGTKAPDWSERNSGDIRMRPKQPHYLDRKLGGRMVPGWNLMVPAPVLAGEWETIR
jgi:hypothetical protein